MVAEFISTVPGTARTVTPLRLLPESQLLVDDLHATHELYQRHIDEWDFLMAAYSGVRDLVAMQALRKHERESIKNFERRMRELFGFGYTKSIVDLFTFYLFKSEGTRDMGAVAKYAPWLEFTEDCDLYGADFNQWMTEQSRYASIYGFVGILVDKPAIEVETVADARREGVYPFVAAYHPPAILDWQFAKRANGRPYLAFLKLRDDDGLFRLWWPDRWEVWKEPERKEQAGVRGQSVKASKPSLPAERAGQGINRLGEIPFVWLHNLKTATLPIGSSDVHDIARIDLSILRNLSQGEEVINMAAFPMFLEPKKEAGIGGAGAGGGAGQAETVVGESAVFGFDPENPEGTKPQWLESKVAEPIGAILDWIHRKVAEIYRASNAGGMASTEVSSVAKSGAALVAEFQLLNSKLVQKAVNLEKAERRIIELWLRLEGREAAFEDVKVDRPRTYDVHNLAQDLENSLTSLAIVHSRKFQEEIEKATARRLLPGATDEQMDAIDQEIEKAEDFAIRPRRAVEMMPKEEEDLKIDKLEAEVGKAQADVDKTKADADKTKQEAKKAKEAAKKPRDGGGNGPVPPQFGGGAPPFDGPPAQEQAPPAAARRQFPFNRR